ncbi:MAG: hypothetical protein MUP76_05395 [Acidimicrobiia bacterium]|nr:hypothetical protein [Acidimicrobiia bacterium]
MTDIKPPHRTPASRPDRPYDGLLLIGNSWTRVQVAHHLRISPDAVAAHPMLIRLDGPLCFDAAYPCLQFDQEGVRLDVAVVGLLAGRRVPDDEVCDWLVRPNPTLSGVAPLTWLDLIGSIRPVLSALPEPSGPFPGHPGADDGAPEQVLSWVQRQEDSGPGRALDWEAIQARGAGADAPPDLRDLIDSLRRRTD